MMKGIYFLVLELEESTDIRVGALGDMVFQLGLYVYVGSAQNGVESRVSRHLSDDKKVHWHMDYLSKEADIRDALAVEGDREEECRAASYMAREMSGIPGFGCSDCDCDSHLFYWGEGGRGADELVDHLKSYPGSQQLDIKSLEG